ncbi:7tm 6 domain containing protein, partial [Asbolus verrucosus]
HEENGKIRLESGCSKQFFSDDSGRVVAFRRRNIQPKLVHLVCITFTGLTSVCVDTLIASLNMYIATQFDLLCDDLRNLCDPDEAHISRQLIACIQHHKAILSFAANSNEFFNSIIFLQFFVSAISMGLTMFQLT